MTENATPQSGNIARRSFLVGAAVIGGFVVGVVAVRLNRIGAYRLPAGDGEASLGAWLKVADGIVHVAVPHHEMGQGIHSLAALLAAEELQLPANAVRTMQAPIDDYFSNPSMLLDGLPFDEHKESLFQGATIWTLDKILRAVGISATGGSTSTRNIAEPIRACAASALDMLKRAAAAKFNTTVDRIKIADGRMSVSNGASATYAELAAEAAKLSPRTIALPPLALGRHVGKGIARSDVPPKTNGVALYGIDVREPGQLYAAIRHSPRFGGTPQSVTFPRSQPGVRGIVKGNDYVAVVASSYYNADRALRQADIAWDDSKSLHLSTNDVFDAYRAALDKGANYPHHHVADSAGSLAAATGRPFAKSYQVPFLAHATMEPMNATAIVTRKNAKVWAGHQSGYLARSRAAQAAGLTADSVEVATPYLGGGFGRRADLNYIAKAVEIASKFEGEPVQTIWNRAEDMRDDFFRPAAMADVSATLDTDGLPIGLTYRVAAPSTTGQFISRVLPRLKLGFLPDRSAGDGAIFPFYGLPNRSIESFTVDLGVPVGFWRSVGFSYNNFFFETFIDELSVEARHNPIEYRKRLLGAAHGTQSSNRAGAILERISRFDTENKPAPSTTGMKVGRGVALSECFRSFVGQLVDVEADSDLERINVKRVFAVVDCGFAIDPRNVIAQVRSAINFGLSAALYGKVEIEDGQVIPQNFDSYPVVTLADAPEITVEIANSGHPIGGVGEIGTPGIAPALGNAIFSATGRRLRSLPFHDRRHSPSATYVK